MLGISLFPDCPVLYYMFSFNMKWNVQIVKIKILSINESRFGKCHALIFARHWWSLRVSCSQHTNINGYQEGVMKGRELRRNNSRLMSTFPSNTSIKYSWISHGFLVASTIILKSKEWYGWHYEEFDLVWRDFVNKRTGSRVRHCWNWWEYVRTSIIQACSVLLLDVNETSCITLYDMENILMHLILSKINLLFLL